MCYGRKGLISQGQLSNSNAQSSQETLLVIFIIFCMKIQSTHQCLWFSTRSSRLSCAHMALSEVRLVNTNPSVLKTWHWHPTWSLRSGLECNIQIHHLGACCWPVAWPGSRHPCPPCSRRTGLKWTRAPKTSMLWTYLRKMDQNKWAPASLIVTQE